LGLVRLGIVSGASRKVYGLDLYQVHMISVPWQMMSGV
jgi:hypothetical protein